MYERENLRENLFERGREEERARARVCVWWYIGVYIYTYGKEIDVRGWTRDRDLFVRKRQFKRETT